MGPNERNDFFNITMNRLKPAIYLIKPVDGGVQGISLYCNGLGLEQEDAIELVWRHVYILLSLDSPETLLKVSALHFH